MNPFRINLGEIAASLHDATGLSYAEIMQMPVREVLIANIDALAVAKKRRNAFESEHSHTSHS